MISKLLSTTTNIAGKGLLPGMRLQVDLQVCAGDKTPLTFWVLASEGTFTWGGSVGQFSVSRALVKLSLGTFFAVSCFNCGSLCAVNRITIHSCTAMSSQAPEQLLRGRLMTERKNHPLFQCNSPRGCPPKILAKPICSAMAENESSPAPRSARSWYRALRACYQQNYIRSNKELTGMRSHVDFQVSSSTVVLSTVRNGTTVGSFATVGQHVVLRGRDRGQTTVQTR